MNGICVYIREELKWQTEVYHTLCCKLFVASCLQDVVVKLEIDNLSSCVCFSYFYFYFCDRVNNLICISMKADDVNSCRLISNYTQSREKLCAIYLRWSLWHVKFDEKSTIWQFSYRDIKSHNLLGGNLSHLNC